MWRVGVHYFPTFCRHLFDVPMVNKSICMWAHSLLNLMALYLFAADNDTTILGLQRFKQLGITLLNYTYTRYMSINSAYVKLPLPERHGSVAASRFQQSGKFYVRSISVGIPTREYNKQSKIKQVRPDQAVKVELAIWFWPTSRYRKFSTTCLDTKGPYEEAWVFERQLIATWQARLS